ncbi:hypothetical protein [Actinomadura sp. WMMB 499]|uniref:hypothetical protein n=1 Tax=Actinomadura sp. WMMB 499 TaxID=1219491 RepID=UPI001245883A|nr:hypothetical protein [Actinomadura sp. WMMB 499]QFG22870.1 hypothetical protein F7P10_18870 [Actinomadura sp. WMMB 499]
MAGIRMPDERQLPLGPHRDLVAAVHDLYELAGKPAARTISAWIRDQDDLPGTLSHEGVSAVLRGASMPRWANLESLVRVLVEQQRVGQSDAEVTLARIHAFWHMADGGMARKPHEGQDSESQPPDSQLPAHETIARWDHPRLGVVEFRDRQAFIEIFREVGGFSDEP